MPHNNKNFWYFLDRDKFNFIEDFKKDLLHKILCYTEQSSNQPKTHFDNKIFIQDYELPSYESVNLLRDGDNIV
jgi:hypothetical protein